MSFWTGYGSWRAREPRRLRYAASPSVAVVQQPQRWVAQAPAPIAYSVSGAQPSQVLVASPCPRNCSLGLRGILKRPKAVRFGLAPPAPTVVQSPAPQVQLVRQKRPRRLSLPPPAPPQVIYSPAPTSAVLYAPQPSHVTPTYQTYSGPYYF